MEQQQEPVQNVQVPKEVLWYLDNYILLKDYLDRTISRIAARCIRKGNIAVEQYPFYGYILDVLEEISETGEYILAHKGLYPLVEKKIQGGMLAFKKNLGEYKQELKSNSTPDMIKQDINQELDKMKEALGMVDKAQDPTAGAGMSMDEVIEKLMNKQAAGVAATEALAQAQPVPPRPNAPASPVSTPQGQPLSAEQPRIIKKIVKIVKPVNPENRQVVPNKVPEE